MRMAETERLDARVAVVEQHIRAENRHDLDEVMATFGAGARYDDEPWDDHRDGYDGVRSYYTELMLALPDLGIEVKHRHVSSVASLSRSTFVEHTGRLAWLARNRAAVGFPALRDLHVRCR